MKERATKENWDFSRSTEWSRETAQNSSPQLPDESIDVLVTSPPYWGQRMSKGTGIENDPRTFVDSLKNIFVAVLPKLKESGIVWINVGDAYNTPVNWSLRRPGIQHARS